MPLGGATTPEENRALAAAIRAALTHPLLLHTEELEAFLLEHPRTPWRASLLTNLGILWRGTARYGDALRAWEEAWALTKSETSWRGRATADRAASELAYLNAQLGRQQRLRELFAELATRPPAGAAAQRTGLAQMGLASMMVHPERAFRCGPLAVASLWGVAHPREAAPAAIDATASTAQGTSFTQLLGLGRQIGMPLRAVRRRPGSGFVVPSVIHWRLDHFAAIVATETSRGGERIYVIQDPTFGTEVRTTDRWLEQETSGNVLVPIGQATPDGWEELREEESARVWGRGVTTGFDPNAFGDRDLVAQCGSSRGMARHGFHAHTAALHVEDTPIWLNPAFGPAADFKVAYNQADYQQAQMPMASSLGARWTHNWESYLEADATFQTWTRRIGGGGIAVHRRQGEIARERHGGLALSVSHMAIPLDPPIPELITLRHEDGGVDVYRRSEHAFVQRWYLESRSDPQGNEVRVHYDADQRISTIRAADGAELQLIYLSEDPGNERFYTIAEVKNSYGLRALFEYLDHPSQPWRRLSRIRDVADISSSFGYGEVARGFQDQTSPFAAVPDPDFLNSLTTPYGETTFTTGWGRPSSGTNAELYLQRWVQAALPGGEGERIEFREVRSRETDCAGLDPCGFDDAQLEYASTGFITALDAMRGSPSGRSSINHRNYRNTYYWNTVGFARGRSASSFDPRHAHIFHWIHAGANNETIAPILESERPPGEHRIHYLYEQQTQLEYLPTPVTDPSYTARPVARSRVLVDGSSSMRDGEDWFTSYTPTGRVRETTDPAGRRRCYAYSAAPDEDLTAIHAAPCSEISAANRLAALQYYPGGKHLPSHVTGPDGQVTQWFYNVRGQPVRMLRPDGRAIDFVYEHGSSVFPPGTVVPGLSALTEGRLIHVRGPLDASAPSQPPYRESTIAYHPNGTIQSVTDAEGVERQFTFDAIERPLTITAPGDGTPRVTTFDYALRDEAGNALPGTGLEPTTIALPDGQTLTRAYDALHRLIRSANGSADVVRYRYNRLRMQGAEPRFHLVQKLRDDGNDDVLVAWSVPVTAVPTPNHGILGHSIAFQQSAQWRERLGGAQPEETVLWEPDLLGRIRRVQEGSDVATVLRRADGLPTHICETLNCSETTLPRHELAYEPTGHFQRLTTERWFPDVGDANPHHVRTTAYHSLGTLGALQLASVTESWGTDNTEAERALYSHDTLGWVNRADQYRVPTGGAPPTLAETLYFDRDTLDRPWRVRFGATGANTLFHAYYPMETTAARPNEIHAPFHGCQRSIAYTDATRDFRAREITLRNSSATLTTQTRAYDHAGRIAAEQDQLAAGPLSWRGFYYDAAGRLQWAYDANALGGYWRNYESTPHGASWFFGIHDGSIWIQYAWNFADNQDRTTSRGSYLAGPPESWTNHTVITDPRGRVTDDGEYRYDWNTRDQITRVERISDATSWQFEYDADGRLRRFQEGVQWHRLTWVAGQLQREFVGAERTSQPTLLRTFHVDGVTDDGRRFMYDRDARGSILRFVRNSVVARSWGYDPQGNRLDLGGSETVGSRLGFAGYVTHADTGLMFTPHRVYSARLRQWLSRDPLGDRDSIDGNNLYAYAANDPVNYTDPSGLNPVALIYAIEQRAVQYANDSIGALGTNCQPDPGAYVSGLAYDMVFGAATAAAFGMAYGAVRNLLPRIRGTQRGFRDPGQIDQIKTDMLSGNYRFSSPEGIIAGVRDRSGVYHVTEGHHRMAAALEIHRSNGDRSFVDRLLQHGRWSSRTSAPHDSRPMPARDWLGNLRNIMGF